jgi:hypothetical protein
VTDYATMLEDGYKALRDLNDAEQSRLDYLSDHIFDFTTYDSAIGELFATKAIEVCTAINERTTFDYIKDPENYRWFLLMCNMPFFYPKLDWGGSIRGAWWSHDGIELDTCGLWANGSQIHEPMKFTSDEWWKFIAAVIAFGTAESALQ